jgi:hypothetical protein
VSDDRAAAADAPVQWTVLRDPPVLAWLSTGVVAYVLGSLLAVLLAYPFRAAPLADWRRLALFGGVALAVGLLSLYLLVPALRAVRTGGAATSAQSGRWFDRTDAVLVADVAAVQLLLAYLLGAAALTLNAAVAGVLLAVAIVAFPARRLLEGDGEYDPDDGTLTFGGRTVALDDVRAVDPVPLGSVTYLRLRVSTDASASTLPGVPMPTATYERLEDELRRNIGDV